VGAGPFVTELHDAVGLHLQNVGGEFGTTTGRPRRCGWLDMVVVRHAVRLNGLTSMAMTKLDVLSELPQLRVCVAYDIDGQIAEDFPGSISRLARAKPIYEELEGWSAASCRSADIIKKGYGALPKNMRKYLDFVTTNAGVPIDIISFGKGREETIDLRKRRW
jgi:adenylosuccinate synthase